MQPLLKAHNYVKFRMSHEAKSARDVYRSVYGLPFAGVNPGADGGLDWLDHYMQVDCSRPDPFGRGFMGAARFYLIVADDRRAYPAALRPDDLHDSDLCRYQLKNWRNRRAKLTEAGEVEYGPLKLNDDFGNLLMMLFHDNAVRAAPLTQEERIVEQMPAHLRPEAVAEVTDPHERARRLTAQLMQRRAAEQRVQRPRDRGTVAAWRALGEWERRRW